jgi:hypothetical protein
MKMPQAVTLLEHDDIQQRMQAASFLIKSGPAAIEDLRACVTTNMPDSELQAVMAAFVLEQIARSGHQEARTALEAAPAAVAGGALRRLDAAIQVNELRQRLNNPKPLTLDWTKGVQKANAVPIQQKPPESADDF